MFAVYTTSTLLFDKTFSDYLKVHGGIYSESWMNILYLPWIFKPLYGFISDKYFLFKFRVKGYAILLALGNIVATISLYFVVDANFSFKVSVLFLLLAIVYTNLAFIDATARRQTPESQKE